jgi:Domain of unknown function (DUF4190)
MADPPVPPQSQDTPENSTPAGQTPPGSAPQPAPGAPPSYPPPSYPPPSYPPSSYPPPSYPPPSYPPQAYPTPGTYPPGTYPPGSYPPPPYPGYPGPLPTGPRNGLGTGALIASILSLPAAFTVFGGFILAIAGIVLGVMGYNRARRGEATNGGMAIASIVLGVLGIILSAALIALGIWGFLKVGGGDYVDCVQRAGSDPIARIHCEEQFRESVNERLSVTPTPPR